ncbi:hypothetical protein ACWFMI_12950 [Nocardiopsis terrae]
MRYGTAAPGLAPAAGYPVRYSGEPEDFVRAQVAEGLSEEEARGAVASFEALRAMGDAEPSGDVPRVTGREPRDFRDYAADAAPAWRDY